MSMATLRLMGVRLGMAILGLCLASGCRTTSSFSGGERTHQWTHRSVGQAAWMPTGNTEWWTGDLLIFHDTATAQSWVEMSKGPVILFRFEGDGKVGRIRVASGRRVRPLSGRSLLHSLPYQLVLATIRGVPGEGWIWRKLDQGGFELEFPETGEKLHGYLSPQ